MNHRHASPLTGAYYWVPSPVPDGVAWNLTTCHDLGVWDGVSHREFWPHVLDVLAAAWGKDAESIKDRLREHPTGLPRGRIVHPKSGYVIIHGGDAPTPDWLDLVKSRFRLAGVEAVPEFTVHEKMLGDDPGKLQEALGVSFLSGRRPKPEIGGLDLKRSSKEAGVPVGHSWEVVPAMVVPDREAPNRKPKLVRPAPLSGAWYRFPKPVDDGVSWSILTCHDAGLTSETGHARLWLWVLDQLALAWNRDADQLKRRLGLYYTGLPRGRVTRQATRPEKTYLILHGDDAPISGWRSLVVERFQLSDAKIKVLFDEHETQIIGHPEEFTSVFSRVQPLNKR